MHYQYLAARGRLSDFFSRVEFCNLLAKYAFPAKKVVIKIEERENPCKMIYVSNIFF